jgi:drug/metabolite transporter (DMT)-like permease
VSSILLGVLFLHEHLTPRHFLGLAFIGLGMAFIDGRFLMILGHEAWAKAGAGSRQ